MNTQLEGLWHFFQNFSVEMLVSNAFYASLTMGNKAINQKVWGMAKEAFSQSNVLSWGVEPVSMD